MAKKTRSSVSAIGQLSLGQSVLFYSGDAKEWVAGIVRFLGTTDFTEGEWIGLELKEAHGKNDGEVKGKRYFTCQPKHGVFTKPGMVRAALMQSRTTTHHKQKRTGRLRPEIVVAEEGPAANQTPPPDLHSEPSQAPGAVQSMPLEAKAKKRELIDLLGGEDEVAKHKKASRDVQQKVNQMLKEGEDPASQPAIFQGIGLQRMLHMAEHFKQEFDNICWELEKRLKDHHDVSYTAAPIKSFASASSKVSTEYHGNCTQLKDVVRGTMVINSTEEQPPSLRDAYDILRKLVAADDILRKVNARFSRFSDRYQKPVGASKYRDWLFLIKVGDFICELQVNFKEAVEVKEAEQHQDYEMERLGTRKLLEASMSNDPSMVQLLLSSARVHQKTMANTRDCHGYTPLQYAARHGSMEMLEHLLPAGADVLALDREGFPAIHHALQASHPKVTERLLDEMLKLPAAKLRKEPLASRIQGVWGAAHQASNPAMQGLVERFTELAKKCYTVASMHLHAIARSGDVSAMRAAFARLPPEYVELGWHVIDYDPVEGGDTEMLDQAILSGSAAMAEMVQDPEVHGALERVLRQGRIHMHEDPQQIRKAVRHGQVARFRAYHKVNPPDAATMAKLLVEACEAEHLEMAFELWTLGGDSVQEALGTEAKEKLAELGGRAAALCHVEYLQLLVDAGVPLDHCMEGSRSMIIRAASAGQTQAVELLANARANLTRALPEAVGYGHGAAAEALLRHRADPHETWGYQPCQSVIGQAIIGNRPEMLRLLAEHGADSYMEEHLVFAEEEQAAECLEHMRSYMAKGQQLENQ